jgi:hypothetical protein
VRPFSDAITTELTAPSSTVTWLTITMVDDGGWTTTINAHGQVEWTLPPHLDTGQTCINDYHRPERMLNRKDDEPDEEDEPESPRRPLAFAGVPGKTRPPA